MNNGSVALLVAGIAFAQLARPAAVDLIGPQDLVLPDARAEIARTIKSYNAISVSPLADKLISSASYVPLDLRGAKVSQLGVVKIRPDLLKQPGVPVGVTGAFARNAPLSQHKTLSLNLGTEKIVLRVTSVVYDSRFDLYHSTAVILNRDGSYARFTINQAGDVAGTVYLPSSIYRIVPGSLGIQHVVRFAESTSSGVAMRTQFREQAASSDLASLERRHSQATIVAELQPRVFMLAKSNLSVYLEAAELGRVSTGVLDENELKNALLALSPLTNAREDSHLRMLSNTRGPDGSRIVQFEQLINGIPLNQRNDIVVDSLGRIIRVNSSLLTEEISVAESLLPERQALDIALRAVAAHHKSPSEFQLSRPSTIRYEFAVGGGVVEPIFRFFLQADTSSAYEVLVNANSGAAEVTSGSVQAIEIFRATSGSPDSGSAAGAQQVWDASGNCTAGYTVCSTIIPPKVAYNWRYYWNAASFDWNEAACCENLDIDIVVNTSAALPGGEYRTGTNSILFPATGEGAGGRNPDSVLHELGHAYIDQYNIPGTVGSDHVSRAIREGIADAVAATYPPYEEEQIGWRDYNYGNDWVILDGEGAYSVAERRDLSTPRQWSYVTTETDFHAASMAIGNFFYRLKLGNFQDNAGMVRFVQRVAYELRDVEGDGRIDLLDLKRATYVAVNNDSALIAHINSTWEAMSTQQIPGGQVPAPPGAPSAPSGVLSVPTGCVSGFSTYSVHWDAPANTTYYVTYVKLPNSLLYGVSDRIDAPQNWGYGYTNYNTDARIAACNAAGCSLMSPSAGAMPHNQCGF